MTREFLISKFEESQNSYLKLKNKIYLKKQSQFFTPTDIAFKMLETIDVQYLNNMKSIRILEPSAGCGILILVVIMFLIEKTDINHIFIDAYEIDSQLCNILKDNIVFVKKYLKQKTNIKLSIKIRNTDFIFESFNKKKYNLILSNPPFKKSKQNSTEALLYKELIFGQPNQYLFFIAKSLNLLSSDGIYVLISPRNYLVGDYSKKLRNFIFKNFSLVCLHSFDRRNIFRDVNQEIIISTFIKQKNIGKIKISYNNKFSLVTDISGIIYDKKKKSLVIPKSYNDLNLLKRVSSLQNSLTDLGLKLSVGPVVQFRNKEYILPNIINNNYVPLLISGDIQINNKIVYYERENDEYRKTHNKAIDRQCKYLVKNLRYILIRKVVAMDDKNIIIPAVLEENFFKNDFLGLDNNLLYLHVGDKKTSISREISYGLYCYLNSKQLSDMFSLINGTHTINISDFDNIRFPETKVLENIGRQLIEIKYYDKGTCSKIIQSIL